MPVLDKNMQKKEKDTCSKDETVSDCFRKNKTRRRKRAKKKIDDK